MPRPASLTPEMIVEATELYATKGDVMPRGLLEASAEEQAEVFELFLAGCWLTAMCRRAHVSRDDAMALLDLLYQGGFHGGDPWDSAERLRLTPLQTHPIGEDEIH